MTTGGLPKGQDESQATPVPCLAQVEGSGPVIRDGLSSAAAANLLEISTGCAKCAASSMAVQFAEEARAASEALAASVLEERSLDRLALRRLEDELRLERRLVQQMRHSRSWRYTRPLHAARVKLRDSWKGLRRWLQQRAIRSSEEGHVGDPTANLAPVELSAAQETVLRLLQFPVHERPVVSIVIPCYGQLSYTLACLRSIQLNLPSASVEVIVVEDASTEHNVDRLAEVPGLRYLRRTSNLGFIRSCNQATQSANGEFLHLLNNDTEVSRNWLDSMLRLFEIHPDCGLVGSRLLNSDGSQQEAGCIVWNDATVLNYGRLDEASRSLYSYVRETDYCSGASLLIRAETFRTLGGFDEAFAPAYCEDSDLAFRVREAGLKVYYQPESQVTHHEGVSHGKSPTGRIKAIRVANERKLRARWSDTLRRQHFPPGSHSALARDRSFHGRRLLIIDHRVPQPDRDAGSRTIRYFIEAYLSMGFNVKFWPDDLYNAPNYTRELQQLGVEVFYGREYQGRFKEWLIENGAGFSHVLLSRPQVAAEYLPTLRAHSSACVLYYGHDIHHLRLAEEWRLRPQDTSLKAEAERLMRLETSVWTQVDHVYYPSLVEVSHVSALLGSQGCSAQVHRAQPYCFDEVVQPDPGDLHRRRDLLLVAGFGHAPNVDAALWFCTAILPCLTQELPGVILTLVGSNPPPTVLALAGAGVRVLSDVPDSELKRLYASTRVVVAPLRAGGGIKCKVLEAAAHGVPLVTTSVGYQGLDGLADASPPADSVEDFVLRTLQLLRDDLAWARSRALAVAYVRKYYSRESMMASLELDGSSAS